MRNWKNSRPASAEMPAFAASSLPGRKKPMAGTSAGDGGFAFGTQTGKVSAPESKK